MKTNQINGLGCIGWIHHASIPLNLNRPFSTCSSLMSPADLFSSELNGINITDLNKYLNNSNLFVTQAKLESLLKQKFHYIDIPVTTAEGVKLLGELTGISKYKGYFGVYVFIHKIGHKYVGSSNLLRRLMETYFSFSHFNSNKHCSRLKSLYKTLLTSFLVFGKIRIKGF